MREPKVPQDEDARVAALLGLRILDTPPEERFDRITRLASLLFRVPIALVSLVDTRRQWFKSKIGLDACETPRSISFCGHAILDTEPLIVGDALQDVRFADNPLVTGPPNIRFYAGVPLRTPDNKRVGTLCLIDSQPRVFLSEDIERLRDLGTMVETELNRFQELEASLHEMRSIFARLVSHELRTPLTSMIGSLQFMESLAGNDEMPEGMLGEVLVAAEKLGRSVNAIIELAEIDSQALSVTTTSLDLGTLLPTLIAPFEATARKKNVRIELMNTTDNTAAASPVVLRRIINALLENALEFSIPDTPIEIQIQRKDESSLRISIIDCGPGIDMEMLPWLFTPYLQQDASNSRQHEGLGISLAICHRLASAMGGRLGYEPARTGGSHFYLDLPIGM